MTDKKKLNSYPLLGVHDVLPEQLLANRGHLRAVGQQRLLRGGVAAAAAGVVPDVGAHNEASQHLVLHTERQSSTCYHEEDSSFSRAYFEKKMYV